MVTLNQVTPITVSDLNPATTLTGNEELSISQANESVRVSVNALPQGMTAGVITYGNTGGAPFPNYRTLKAGNNVTISDGGAQGDLTISAEGDGIGASWGTITGTLSNQTDLQTALNAKQALNANLTSLSALASLGIVARSGVNTYSLRTLTAGSTKISITDGNGVGANPTIDVNQANLALNSIGGTLDLTTQVTNVLALANGGTAATDAAGARTNIGAQASNANLTGISALAALGMVSRSGINTYSVRAITAGSTKISISNGNGVGGDPTIDVNQANLSIDVSTQATGILPLANGGTNSGTAAGARTNLGLAIGTDVQAFSTNLTGLSGLAAVGMVSRTGVGTFSPRTITAGSGSITVTNGNGSGGNPTIDYSGTINSNSDVSTSSSQNGQYLQFWGGLWTNNGGGVAYAATQFNITSNTTLSTISDFTRSLTPASYSFELTLYTTSNVAGGIKASVSFSGTLTAMIYEALVYSGGAVVSQVRSAASGGTVANVTAVTAALVKISGNFIATGTGNFSVSFAQNASNGTASSVLVGSSLVITRVG